MVHSLNLLSDADGNLDSGTNGAMDKVHMVATMLMAASSAPSGSAFQSTITTAPSGQNQNQLQSQVQAWPQSPVNPAVLSTPLVAASQVKFDQIAHTPSQVFTSGTAWRTSRFHVSNAVPTSGSGSSAVVSVDNGLDTPMTPPPSAPATSNRFPTGIHATFPPGDHITRSHPSHDDQVDVPMMFRHTPPIREDEKVPTSTSTHSPYPSPSASPILQFSAPTYRLLQLSSSTSPRSSNSNSTTMTTTTTTGSTSSSSSSPSHSINSSWYLWTRESGSRSQEISSSLSSSSPNSLRSVDRLDSTAGAGKYGAIGDSSPTKKLTI